MGSVQYEWKICCMNGEGTVGTERALASLTERCGRPGCWDWISWNVSLATACMVEVWYSASTLQWTESEKRKEGEGILVSWIALWRYCYIRVNPSNDMVSKHQQSELLWLSCYLTGWDDGLVGNSALEWDQTFVHFKGPSKQDALFFMVFMGLWCRAGRYIVF